MLPTYIHRQNAPLKWILYGSAIYIFVLAWAIQLPDSLFWIFFATGTLLVALAGSFHHLEVVDDADHLRIRFGPIPAFRRSVAYADIRQVRIGQTNFLDGWGIHYSLKRGWVYNIWGRRCVELELKDGKLTIGTDDAERLAQFLMAKSGIMSSD